MNHPHPSANLTTSCAVNCSSSSSCCCYTRRPTFSDTTTSAVNTSNHFVPSILTTEQSSSLPHPVENDHLREDNNTDDVDTTVVALHYLRNTNRNHIYTEIVGHPSSFKSKDHRCCSCDCNNNNNNNNIRSFYRSSSMAFLGMSVWSAIVAGLVVWIHTILRMHHPSLPHTSRVQLAFNTNRTFKILQLTDLHYGENPYTDWGPEQDSNTTRLIRSMIVQEQPIDLIIVSGDQITANNINGNATVYYEHICQLLENYTIPYAFIFGNHDDATYEVLVPATNDENNNNNNDDDDDVGTVLNTTLRQELMEYITQRSTTKSNLSLSQAGPTNINGVSNYVLNVYNTSGNSYTRVVLQVMLLDSGGGSINEEIVDNQLRWYQQQRIPLTTTMPGNIVDPRIYVDAIAFQHIPTQQFQYRSTSSDTGNNNLPLCQGMNGENGIAPLQNDASNEIQFLYHTDTSLHFLGVGHNHGNSYCCRSDIYNTTTTTTTTSSSSSNNNNNSSIASGTSRVPLHLCFGRHSGYGGYGFWERGARVYELTMHNGDTDDNRLTWKSWVRFENGITADTYEPF